MTPRSAEEERLHAFLRAIYDHGSTTWPNTTCGMGGIGGQALTTTRHGEVVDHLVYEALRGRSLKEAADDWEDYSPGSRRLDGPPGRPRRAGPDGRPL